MLKNNIFLSVTIFLLILLVLLAAEVCLAFLLNSPGVLKFLPKNLRRSVQNIYIESCRDIIQSHPEMARFDPELTYTLKPGRFHFQGVEFNNEFLVNSLGLRDTEEALERPEVISTGDSFAMGWGMDQDKTYAKILEARTGLRVLNAGISSYGTAREMLFLRRLDTSRLKYLIILYNNNDVMENAAFFRNQNRLKPSRGKNFIQAQVQHREKIKYAPFKYIREFINLQTKKPARYSPREEVNLFLNALNQAPVNLEKITIIVMEIDKQRLANTDFVNSLKEIIGQDPVYARFNQNMIIEDLTKILKRLDFHVLDDHLNARGHRKIASLLQEIMDSRKNALKIKPGD